jgi:hypothetical protein
MRTQRSGSENAAMCDEVGEMESVVGVLFVYHGVDHISNENIWVTTNLFEHI